MSTSYEQTEQQAAVCAAFRNGESMAVRAVAGSGKTATLVAAYQDAPQGALALAFNRRNAEDLAKKMPEHVVSRTMNSLGHRAWMKHLGKKVTLDTRKSWTLWNTYEHARQLAADAPDIVKLVALAKSQGISSGYASAPRPNLSLWAEIAEQFDIEDFESLAPHAAWLLHESAEQAFKGLIDFDDQIYMPCQPAGTKVLVRPDQGQGYIEKNIEDIRVNDKVLSFDRRQSKFIGLYNHGSRVSGVASRQYTGNIFTVRADGKMTEATAQHKWLVRFKPDLKKQDLFITYLMRKAGSFKFGICQIRSARSDSSDGFGLAVRVAQEGADAAWILDTHFTLQEAKIAEAINVAHFGITDVSFLTPHNLYLCNAVHSWQKQQIFLLSRVKTCLKAYGREYECPFWYPNQTRAFNSNFITESCNLIPFLMEIPSFTGTDTPNWSTIDLRITPVENLTVYSLDVERHELYIANGLLTHNCMYGSPFDRFQCVAVDEAQDLSPLQHQMVARSLRDKGQIVVVGDPNQAIYSFRGASNMSFNQLVERFNLPIMPLTASFRCPRAVVREAQRYVPDIVAASDREGSVLRTLTAPKPRLHSTVLCRFNAPLVALAFRAIKARVSVNYLGRDFLSGLKALHKKHPTPKALTDWFENQKATVRTEGALARATDRFESLMSLHEEGDVDRALTELLAAPKAEAFTLSTIHKAKGLEWKDVTYLNYHKQTQGDQEDNMRYVGCTRSMDTLTLHGVE